MQNIKYFISYVTKIGSFLTSLLEEKPSLITHDEHLWTLIEKVILDNDSKQHSSPFFFSSRFLSRRPLLNLYSLYLSLISK